LRAQEAIPLINSLGSEKKPFFLLVDFEMKKIQVYPLDDLPTGLLYDFSGSSNSKQLQKEGSKFAFNFSPHSFSTYYHQFQAVKEEIAYGNTFLINLTAKHNLQTDLSLQDIFHQAEAKYKVYMEDNFVVFSPETFVSIEDGYIVSRPMKGTIDAEVAEAEAVLQNDPKELAEHRTIVDLIRNDLSIHAKEVRVEKLCYLDLIRSNKKDLYQMSSKIRGRLPENFSNQLGDLLFSMLPAGSVSGAPKKKTTEIISRVEDSERGYYTGICGIYDGRDFDSCVMIRYIEKQADQLYYYSGGGITFQSAVEKEYQEMLVKIYLPTS